MSWRLFTDRGQQVWKWMQNIHQPSIPFDKNNQNSGDKIWRRQALEDFKPIHITPSLYERHQIPQFPSDPLASTAVTANLKAVHYFKFLQMSDGHWPGDYGGPMFLLPGVIIVCTITGVLQAWPSAKKEACISYLLNHQNDDGGWGIHIEAPSTQFGTVLNYIALRLLGLPPNHKTLTKPRAFIHKHGGAMTAPSWAKFWLCVAGLADWRIYNSVFPELWLFPESLPLHPWRWWCHCRMVYLPMAYLYAIKYVGPITPLIQEIRKEIYTQPYDSIRWSAYRDSIAAVDLYTPQTTYLKVLNFIANTYEAIHIPYFRSSSADFLLEYIKAEDDQTKHVDIGPVNKFINMLSIFAAYGPDSTRFKQHTSRVDDYLWIAEDGMKCQGYNGSQLWDTAFATQAITSSGVASVFHSTLESSYHYLEISQVREDVANRVMFYRHLSKGGWPFSTIDHGWPISDCTSEGVKAVLALHDYEAKHKKELQVGVRIDEQRMYDAIQQILSYQNEDGGWATYENKRAGGWMELINPAEVFAGIMVDYSYVECSSACLQAMTAFRKHYPHHRSREIIDSIAEGVKFIKNIQRPDGSWYGSWAVCFTYGAWFAIEGLIGAGESSHSASVRKGCEFLLSKQKNDGGWGESYESCVLKEYVQHEKSQIVNTAWALLALMRADWEDDRVIERGIQLILSRQQKDGDWMQEGISGVFNGNCMITYSNYRNIFPIWAIGKFIERTHKKYNHFREG